MALGLYFGLTVVYAITNENYATVPFLLLFVWGYFYTGFMSLSQSWFAHLRFGVNAPGNAPRLVRRSWLLAANLQPCTESLFLALLLRRIYNSQSDAPSDVPLAPCLEVMKFRVLPVLLLFAAASALPRRFTASLRRRQSLPGMPFHSTPGIVEQWQSSAHAKKGVDCYSCHKANASDPATFDHYGYKIAVIVTPNYCARCHATEVKQFEKSHHAAAAKFIGSLDNMLGEIVEGGPAANNGCRQCHGSEVKYLGDGKFDPATWPNSGIGRVNPDGSKGSCAACHGRHTFSSATARMPENCGKCHLGPDHPQIEIYNESKHGIQYRANIAKMNLDSKSWVVGKDYSAAPTCATCHMSATSESAGHP